MLAYIHACIHACILASIYVCKCIHVHVRTACTRAPVQGARQASAHSRACNRAPLSARACGGAKIHARMHAHVQRVRACIHGFILVQNEKCVKPGTLPFADGHTASNAPDLFRPPKLSGAGPG